MLCWAYAISSMLRNSLLKYGKVLTEKVKASDFHKRLRNEIIMGPVPKAKYFDLKNSTRDRKHEIITAQGHIVTSAVERVRKSNLDFRLTAKQRDFNFFKLVYPTAIDPPGLQLLQSIRNVVDIDNIKYKIEEYSNATELANAIRNEKYPVIVAEKQPESIIHAMVAYGISKAEKTQCVKCKDSYGLDSSRPGNFHNRFQNHNNFMTKQSNFVQGIC